MAEALRAAQSALEEGEVPIGAVVVRDGEIVARGWNRSLQTCDPTAHAEIVALREA
ncbi:MAG: nucleoside deaminase, partial [Acidobacteriales bacterium]|nr:nucleoside deaminase [Terriglobales bacterium]